MGAPARTCGGETAIVEAGLHACVLQATSEGPKNASKHDIRRQRRGAGVPAVPAVTHALKPSPVTTLRS